MIRADVTRDADESIRINGSFTGTTDELLDELRLRLNHARQSAITTEISEIAGGAAALNNNN